MKVTLRVCACVLVRGHQRLRLWMTGDKNVIAQESVSRKEGRKTGEMLSSPQAEWGGRDNLFHCGQKHGRRRLRWEHADQPLAEYSGWMFANGNNFKGPTFSPFSDLKFSSRTPVEQSNIKNDPKKLDL